MKIKESQRFFGFLFPTLEVRVAMGLSNPYEFNPQWGKKQARPKALGQVCTPQKIARLMAAWVTSTKPRTVLDPAVGFGNLLYECWLMHPRAAFVGIDRDSDTLAQTEQSAPKGTSLICTDYLKTEIGSVEGVIANPPYVKAHHLDYVETDWRFFEEKFGTKLDRLTNLYGLFLLKIWEDLKTGGRASVIIPLEFLNANFGTEIKERMVHHMRPVGVAVFDPVYNVFDQAMTTSCILFLEKGRPLSAPVHARKVSSEADVENFVADLLTSPRPANSPHRYVDLAKYKPDEKWLNRILGRTGASDACALPKRIGDYFRCLRGIATGANSFFCLRKTEIEKRGIDFSSFAPCITKASDANGLVFGATEFEALAKSQKRCFLLNPSYVEPSLTKYLKEGEQIGIPHRYLPSHRPVWYAPENRDAADVWVAVFSRESLKCVLNLAHAKNLTCFHGLYAKESSPPLSVLITLFLNSSLGREAFLTVNRFYGDGLNKLEPKDVEAMPCPQMPIISERRANDLVERMMQISGLPLGERQTIVDEIVADIFGVRAESTTLVSTAR